VGIGRVIEQPRYDKNMNVVPRRIVKNMKKLLFSID